MPDRQIARLLNPCRQADRAWQRAVTQTRRLRSPQPSRYRRPLRKPTGAERGEITLEAVAQIMDVERHDGATGWSGSGIIKGRQVCRGAPWVIKAEDVAAYPAASLAAPANSR